MSESKGPRDSIRAVARLYVFCAAIIGLFAGIGAVTLATWGGNLLSIGGAVALLTLAAILVATLLLFAQLFELFVEAVGSIQEQTRLLRELVRIARSRPED
ncbi:MAG: hypothetical protein CME06_03190 [Gemmatimonadetes bacterium]|nr:hypothetical protein [Gemmatimonadota bacterium]